MHHEPVIFTGIFGAGSIFALLATAVLQKTPQAHHATPSPDVDAPTKVSRRSVVITSQDAEGEAPTLIMERANSPMRAPVQAPPPELQKGRSWLDWAVVVVLAAGFGALIALGFVNG